MRQDYIELLDDIPQHNRAGLKRYIEHGIKPGSFLEAVLCNDLLDAVRWADHDNRQALPAYVFFLLRYAPTACYGSRHNYEVWIDPRNADRANDWGPREPEKKGVKPRK